MKHLACLLFVLCNAVAGTAQESDTAGTDTVDTAFLYPDDSRDVHFDETTQAVQAVLDPVQHVARHAFSFPAFSTIPGETEPYQNIRYSHADGLFLGLGSDTRRALWFDSTLLMNGGFGYATASHYWQVFGGLDKRFGPRETATLIGVEAHILTGSHDAWRSAPWENTYFSLFFNVDARNWFRRSGWSAHLEQYIADVNASVMYQQETYEYLPKDSWSLLNWSGNSDGNAYRVAPVFERAQTQAVIAAVTYSSLPRLPRFLGGVRASAQVEIGRYNDAYDRTVADVAWHQPVWPVLTFNTRLRTGAANGDVIVPKLFTLGGWGTMPGFAWNELAGNRMTLLNAEVLLYPSPFAKSRLWSSLSIILLADAGYISLQEKGTSPVTGLLPASAKDWRTDVGLALGSRNGFIAGGVVWRTDTGQPTAFMRFSSTFR